jgi:hypothetical protein
MFAPHHIYGVALRVDADGKLLKRLHERTWSKAHPANHRLASFRPGTLLHLLGVSRVVRIVLEHA